MQGPYLVQMGNTHNACINGHRRRRLFLSLLLLADSTRAKLGFDSIVTKENHKEEAEGGTLTKHSITPKPHKLYTSRWRGGGWRWWRHTGARPRPQKEMGRGADKKTWTLDYYPKGVEGAALPRFVILSVRHVIFNQFNLRSHHSQGIFIAKTSKYSNFEINGLKRKCRRNGCSDSLSW